MKTIYLSQSIGFGVKPPVIEHQLFTNEILTGFTSRDFGHPYESMEEQIAGNLYLWLQQSYSVLWEVNVEGNSVILYSNIIDKLGERFSTLLRLPKEVGKAATLEMVKAVALSNFIIEEFVFKIEGNWLLKYRNPSLNGLLKHFVFWMALLELEDNENAQKCLALYMKKFAKDVDLMFLEDHSLELIMKSFITCFFKGSNEMAMFRELLHTES
jgi:hypothetical protein